MYVVMRVTTTDFAKWKTVFDASAPLRAKFGGKGGQLFRSLDNPNDVTIVAEYEDAARAKAFLASPELREAMAKAGVAGPPSTYMTEKIGDFKQ